uniref:L domain-like protein n=1 Tax=Parastrongyloides trichosuri TaxID=131310 RepID=A0A0N4ZJW7_PARTI
MLTFIIFIFLANYLECVSDNTPSWSFVDDHHNECVALKVDATLTLTYFQENSQEKSYVSIPLLATSTVNRYNSSCNTLRNVNSLNITSQILSLDFPKNYVGWGISFFFSNDTTLFKIPSNNFGLYQIQIDANFSSMPNTFINPKLETHKYISFLDFNDNNDLFNSIYAETDHSYFCPSSNTYELIGPEEDTLEASITLKNFRTQAYTNIYTSDDEHLNNIFSSTTTKINFQEKETCPSDQSKTDWVPIISGSILTALILINLLFYLFYRYRLSNDVLAIVNPNSHFADKIYDKKMDEFDSLDRSTNSD